MYKKLRLLYKIFLILLLWVPSGLSGADFTLRSTPPAPDSGVKASVLELISKTSDCGLPGAIPPREISAVEPEYDEDSVHDFYDEYGDETYSDSDYAEYDESEEEDCDHPLLKYISIYSAQNDSADTSVEENTAIYTFNRFCMADSSSFRRLDSNHFRHANFLSFLKQEKEPKVIKESWVIRMLDRAWLWIEKVFKWIDAHFTKPLRGLDLSWKIILSICTVFLLIVIAFLLSRFVGRLYPQQEAQLSGNISVTTKRSPSPQDAQEYFLRGELRQSISVLYDWAIFQADRSNIVKRYEWWTNRQFIKLLSERESSYGLLARNIIRFYEDIVFGHRTVELSALESLISQSIIEMRKIR